MSTIELRKRLISKIEKTENDGLLEEVHRLLNIEMQDIEEYKLSDEQKSAVVEARKQIISGHTLTDQKADNEINEWLNK